jgi:thiol peroxidase
VKIFIEFLAEDFPCSTGLLADGLMLFARSVIVIDPKGIVRYIQVVPEMSHLPDMDKAFEKAIDLAK